MLKNLVKFLFLLICFFLQAVSATESDPYTYSDIYLEDSSVKINELITQDVLRVLDRTNEQIQSKLQSGRSVSIRELEYLFFDSWLKQMRYAPMDRLLESGLVGLAIGDVESCITKNNCETWPFIERIVLNRDESIFDLSAYNPVTVTWLAPIVNFCGYRIGADKFTHFFSDGFRFYGLWVQGIGMDKLKELSWQEELGGMGKTFTEVMSNADVNANLDGVRFYKNFFFGKDPILSIDKDNNLVLNRNIDLCQAQVALWDETNTSTGVEFTGSRSSNLLHAIEERKKNPNPDSNTREVIINRSELQKDTFDSRFSMGEHLEVGLKLMFGTACEDKTCVKTFKQTMNYHVELNQRQRVPQIYRSQN